LGVLLLLLVAPLAGGVSTFCPLPWNANASMPRGIDMSAECPWGHRLAGFDVTIPKHAKVVSVESICVLWGLMPFMVIGFSILDSVISSFRLCGIGTRELSFLLFVGVMVASNEFIFKRLAMEPRPERSCNYSCGFPSGHSVMSCGFFMLMFLDAVFRTMPRVPLNLTDARDHEQATAGRNTIFGWTLREIIVSDFRAWLTFMPLSKAHTLNQTDFACFAMAWGLALLPVPFSRVVLNDHTPKQVLVGSALGMLEAVIYFGMVRSLQHRYNHLLGRRVFGVFVHDFPLPVYETCSKCYRLLARVQDDSVPSKPELAATRLELAGMRHELKWYMLQLEPSCDWASFDEDHIIAAREMDRLQRLKHDIEEQLEADGVTFGDESEESWISDGPE